MKYFDQLSNLITQYFKVLSLQIPEFLREYVETTEIKRLSGIGLNCGTDYTNLYNNKFFYSRLDHSVGVALIIWNFTKDIIQTLAGLFHDYPTPAFSHVIDFLKGDALTQEITEKDNKTMLENSPIIMNLLKRDHININDICNYKIYPIADNQSPQLSADRLEYTFSSGLSMISDCWTLSDIESVYNNITILKNEDNIDELGFSDVNFADLFVKNAYRFSLETLSNKNKMALQFLADILKLMLKKQYINENNLYNLSEQELINTIKNCNDTRIKNMFMCFENLTEVNSSNWLVKNKYCINISVKKRYINPLVKSYNKNVRSNEISAYSKEQIDSVLGFFDSKFAYIDCSH